MWTRSEKKVKKRGRKKNRPNSDQLVESMLSSSISRLLDSIVSQIRLASKSALGGPALFSKREYQVRVMIHSELTGLIKASHIMALSIK